jgi:hypothetical protein
MILKTLYVDILDKNLILYHDETYGSIVKELNNSKNKDISDWLLKNKYVPPSAEFSAEGAISVSPDQKMPLVIFIKTKKKHNWDFYNTIMHEVNHLIERYSVAHCFEDEMEFKAYLTENLFTLIRRNLK